jgi:hypothetical protein
MSAADWIMRAATHNAPLDRREWAHAMEAEFDTLEKGKLSWAFGCWSAMAQWRMRDDLPFLALLAVITLLSWKGRVLASVGVRAPTRRSALGYLSRAS